MEQQTNNFEAEVKEFLGMCDRVIELSANLNQRGNDGEFNR